ncbi:winged helix-turn-helix transcriptional regulator [Haloarchaeobius iranensis]|uniref:Winged helix-turn-helix DNA-binding n=1 Tax=Haloarchaeobius iranensis TaxID=996166 RepID=A0A1G9YPL1_9EURY|nr:helix-turn-helix domain-containing protein [Haloarchaeobius iranensis]SDN10481.1 Winged helix-turn-helix DNA-binding [Haloarchaeobius iranensis]
MSDVRRSVHHHIESHPGVHFNELARELDIATGQAQYHLRRLLEAGRLDTEELRGRTHYFPTGYDPWEQRTIALLRRETVRGIIVAALEEPEPSAAELAEELDVARSTLSWHVSTLVEAGVAEKCYDQQGRSHITLTRPEETRRLLDEVTPSLPDRLVDRFTRLVDDSFLE